MSNYSLTNMNVSVGELFHWDISAVIGYVGVVMLLQPFPVPTPVRFVLAIPLLCFFPGYALSTVLFPASSTNDASRSRNPARAPPGIDGVERAGLSVGLSLALLPLFAFGFSVTYGTIVGPIVMSLSGFVILASLIGGFRRSRLPEHLRFSVPLGRWIDEAVTGMKNAPLSDTVVNLVLAISVLVAIGVLGVAFAVPQDGPPFTEFAVGTTDDGEFVTSGYPTDLDVNERAEFALLLENNEGEPMNYAIVAQFERVEGGTVTSVAEAGTVSTQLEPGETSIERHTVTPEMTGDDLRVTFLLFVDDPPAQPDRETAYRSVHVWLSVG